MFSPNTDSLGCQPFKEASWAFVLGLPLRDTINGLLLVLGPFLIPTFGLMSWACAPIISNPISSYFLNLVFSVFMKIKKTDNQTCSLCFPCSHRKENKWSFTIENYKICKKT